MSHGYHRKPRRIFGDDCEECVERASTVEGLAELDSTNIVKLGDLAAELSEMKSSGKWDDVHYVAAEVSYADEKAVEKLRLAARIVFASGITEEVAR